ncbi:hypothetical protein GCM10010405_29920 [Streptomyces macrosporus]|uniref:Uncharacterized protein n=1 Tax=Streptomyces macrosporus TaxID=44032 RepID=A0ABN3JZN7_9ACTN
MVRDALCRRISRSAVGAAKVSADAATAAAFPLRHGTPHGTAECPAPIRRSFAGGFSVRGNRNVPGVRVHRGEEAR